MKQWFISLENKELDLKVSVYEDGTVYGKERGQKIGILNTNAMEELNYIIKDNLGDFRKLGYHNYKDNQFILRINDTVKHRTLKIIGWPQTPLCIGRLLHNKRNFAKLF